MLLDSQTQTLLQVELAAVVDAGKPMVEATNILEGDGTLSWKSYEQLLVIHGQNSINAAHLANLTAVSRHISGGNPVVAKQCFGCGVSAVQPGWDYFNQTVMGAMNQQVEIFKAARLFSPCSPNRPVAPCGKRY